MKATGLIDTGALLAVLDRSDEWHERCVAALGAMRLPLATSAAVLTELFHLLEPHEWDPAWNLIRSGAVEVLPTGDEQLPSLEALMRKYRDLPMDFADATLVELAERHGWTTVLTVDVTDFETYRIAGRRRFRVLPGR